MKVLPKILLLTGLFLFMEGITSACVCIEFPNPTPEQVRKRLIEEADWANVIFSGEVLSVDTLKVKFKVDRVWRGEYKNEITMSTGAKRAKEGNVSFSSCDYEFKAGEKYIVYAKMIGDDLQTSKCTGTGLLKNAESRIDFLDELKQKKNRRRDKS
jgi:hypothetical protein